MHRNGILQRLRVDDDVPLLVGRRGVIEFRERNAQRIAHVDHAAEKVRPQPLDHADDLELLAVDIHLNRFIGSIGIVQLGDIPQHERRHEHRDENRRDVLPQPLPQIIEHNSLSWLGRSARREGNQGYPLLPKRTRRAGTYLWAKIRISEGNVKFI